MEKLRNILKWFLPLLFIAYLGGITLFTHSHVVNGVIIVHSHPFKGEHSHTEAQVETIFFLSSFVASSLPAILFAASAFPYFVACAECSGCGTCQVRAGSLRHQLACTTCSSLTIESPFLFLLKSIKNRTT